MTQLTLAIYETERASEIIHSYFQVRGKQHYWANYKYIKLKLRSNRLKFNHFTVFNIYNYDANKNKHTINKLFSNKL